MAKNFKILKEHYTPKHEKNTLLAIIDGNEIETMAQFFTSIAKQLELPSYFGKNLDALYDCLCDFSWADVNAVHIVFKDYDHFLSKEPQQKRWDILAILNDSANEWRAMKGTDKIKFEISVEPSQRIKADIEAAEDAD
jgi:RNAse (barnase) inhibitor barstar